MSIGQSVNRSLCQAATIAFGSSDVTRLLTLVLCVYCIELPSPWEMLNYTVLGRANILD